jgi:hypothetical protein
MRNDLTPTDGVFILIHNKSMPPDLDSKIIKVKISLTFVEQLFHYYKTQYSNIFHSHHSLRGGGDQGFL